MRSVFASAAIMSMTGLALAQTQPTPPSAYATPPTMPSAFATAPNSPCYGRSIGGAYRLYDARRGRSSSFNPTSPCYSGTPYPNYSASGPFETARPTNRPTEPGAADLDVSEATARIEAKGYLNVSGLAQDRRGIWRGQAMVQDGRDVDVTLDLQGNIYSELSRVRIWIRKP